MFPRTFNAVTDPSPASGRVSNHPSRDPTGCRLRPTLEDLFSRKVARAAPLPPSGFSSEEARPRRASRLGGGSGRGRTRPRVKRFIGDVETGASYGVAAAPDRRFRPPLPGWVLPS